MKFLSSEKGVFVFTAVNFILLLMAVFVDKIYFIGVIIGIILEYGLWIRSMHIRHKMNDANVALSEGGSE